MSTTAAAAVVQETAKAIIHPSVVQGLESRSIAESPERVYLAQALLHSGGGSEPTAIPATVASATTGYTDGEGQAPAHLPPCRSQLQFVSE
jgi:hypothetical protein